MSPRPFRIYFTFKLEMVLHYTYNISFLYILISMERLNKV